MGDSNTKETMELCEEEEDTATVGMLISCSGILSPSYARQYEEQVCVILKYQWNMCLNHQQLTDCENN